MSVKVPDPQLGQVEFESPVVPLDDSILARAGALRFPDLSELRGRERVEALCDHIVATAIVRGDLEELRLEAHVKLLDANGRLAEVPAATTRRKDEIRRALAPEIATEIDRARWVVDRCTEQINRLGGTDYDAASRAYTLVGG